MNKLTNRIVLFMVLVSLLATGTIGVLLFQRASSIVEREANEKLSALAAQVAGDFDQELQQIRQLREQVDLLVKATMDLDKLSYPGYMYEVENQLAPVIRNMAQEADISKSVYVFFDPSLDGNVHDVWYADLDDDGFVERQAYFEKSFYEVETEDKAWYFAPKNTGEANWTDPYIGNVAADEHITYISHTAPIYVNGRFVGVSGVDYYFTTMKERIGNIRVYDTGYAALINDKGELLIHPVIEQGVPLAEIDDGNYAWMLDVMNKAPSGVYEYTWIDDKQKIMAYNQLTNGWTIGIMPPKEEVLLPVRRLREISALMVLLGVLLSAVAAIVFGRRLVRPIESIVLDINRIGLGNYEDPIRKKYLQRDDEVGILASAVERMRVLQRDTFDEINRKNEELESTVHQRTEELRTTNTYLEHSLAQLEEQQAELIETNERLEDSLETIRKTQRQLIESEKIAALGYLVGGIAHEINTPVGNSIMLVSYMNKQAQEVLDKYEDKALEKLELENFVEEVTSASDTLMRNLQSTRELVERFKQLSAAESQWNRVRFNVCDYLDEIIRSTDAYRQGKDIEVSVFCSKTLEIYSDPGKFSQIVSNLLTNAYVHGFEDRDKGHITIEVEMEQETMYLTFKDNGMGIAKENMDRIFDPFFTTKFSGNTKGLGLNVVYNIVTKLFKGSIQVNSDVGNGTQLYITLHPDVKDTKS